MLEGNPRYDSYKDSGDTWLGDIPAHWSTLKAKYVLQEVSEKGHPDEQLLSATQKSGLVPRDDMETRVVMPVGQLETFKLIRKDDFVISLRSFQGGIEYSEHQGLVSPAYTVLRKKVDAVSKYLKHLFKSARFIGELDSCTTGIRQGKNISFSQLAGSLLPIPPEDEQVRIANFLDEKTAEIDAAIEKKRRLIDLLNEQKAILINRAVTKGLNPDTPMKDSGVDWIGEIPAHWEVKRLKYATQIFRGKFTHRPRNDPRLYDGDYPFLQTGDVARAGKFITTYKQTLNEKGLRVSTLVPQGTVVITIAANIGDIAILGFDACFPDSVVGFRPKAEISRDFVYHALSSMKHQFMSSAIQNAQMNLNVDRIGTNFVPLPPSEEQVNICLELDRISDTSNEISDAAEREISTLNEFKQTLIANAVTGKIKI